MGKRCRWAALGATFALLVAACAATEAPRSTQAAKRASIERVSVPPSTVPDLLANADVPAADAVGTCITKVAAALAVLDSSTGAVRWSIPLPDDASGAPEIVDTTALVPLAGGQSAPPALVSLDLENQALLWRRELTDVPESIVHTEAGVVVVSRGGVLNLDPGDGAVRWVTNTEFGFDEVSVADEMAYAIDAVALHAIDLETGEVVWQLPIERPDEVAVQGDLLAVAAGPRVIAVDTELRGILWEQTVNRTGAGSLHIGPDVVVADLSRAASPVGGVVALDRLTGRERWRLDAIDSTTWVGRGLLITSVVPAQSAPGEPYEIIAVDAQVGETKWSLSSSAPAKSAVAGVSPNRIVLVDPHPGATGVERIRLVDADHGTVLWETGTSEVDGALAGRRRSITLFRYGASSALAQTSGSGTRWEVGDLPPIRYPPVLSAEGIVVLTDSHEIRCVGRELAEPTTS